MSTTQLEAPTLVQEQLTESKRTTAPANRILLAKVGLDGHDRGIKVVARGLRDAGLHVIYGGIWQSPQAVARAATDEDADWLGVSLLNGAHMTLIPRVIAALKAEGNSRTKVLLGGIIPEDDFASLRELGVAGFFGPGTSLAAIIEFLQRSTSQDNQDNVAELVSQAQQQNRIAVSRLLTLISQGRVKRSDLPEKRTEQPVRSVVFTGSAGVGKSSLIAESLQYLCERSAKIAILACDPQSPITGGALLGDRIRMAGPAMERGEPLMRSLAVPSGQQGIAEHLDLMTLTLDAAGFDLAIIESVGVGQGDVACRELADMVVLLLQPESGDDIQWEKAGLLEIADLIVIQKSDLPGADRLERELKQNFTLPGFRTVPIVRVSAAKGDGIKELCDLIMP